MAATVNDVLRFESQACPRPPWSRAVSLADSCKATGHQQCTQHNSSLSMDRLSSPSPRSRSRIAAKSQSRAQTQMKSRRDYVIGIILLLCVVILWTTSNFVTQVRRTPRVHFTWRPNLAPGFV